MNTSSLDLLKSPETLVLAAGHGGSDPGATNGNFKERDQAIGIVDDMAEMLRERGVNVVIAPHEDDTDESIPWVNQRFDFGEAWVIEVHRDSASGLGMDDASRRCGVYTGTSSRSVEVGQFIRQSFLRHGAHPNTWTRLHTQSGHGGLGWIRQTVPAAHLLELGFMQGKNDADHMKFLAKLGAAVLFEAFTGQTFTDGAPGPMAAPAGAAGPKKQARGGARKQAAKKKAPQATSSGDLLKNLATTYKNTDLKEVFKKVKAEVREEDYAELKETSLAQWILESGWASSKLAHEALNFGGLKWRKEMEGFATKYEYTDWQGETDFYCKFGSLSEFITGYWRFIQRDVYAGWTEHTGSSEEYISYLLQRGYTVSDTYLASVLQLVPKAAVLLA